ncbi:MAG: ArnT family glycosyltransferase [Prolixibacteraceae bacterium]
MKRNLRAVSLLLSITALIVFGIFKPVIQHPGNYLFSQGGDAVKSYFNFSYHLKYGDGIKYTGINYPYGEHLQYINSHPLHLAIYKTVSKIFPISDYGVAILNLSMILALLLAVPFIFLILRKYKLPVWYSMIVALIILFLSPQLDRIHGHFEMVYLFYIPMYWYFLLRFREGKKPWMWGSILVLTGLAGGFTSAYFVAFYAIFLISVLFADVWKNRKNLKPYLKPGIILLVMAVLPLLVVKGLVSATDWATDRPYNPWGFYVFHANPFSVFLPPNQNITYLFGKWINMNYEWEGRAYVGLPSSLLAITMVISLVYWLIRRKKTSLFPENPNLNNYLFGGVLVLLFSMCFPFKWGFGFLLELLPPVKQFRALGRFAWIFYYIFTVYSAWFFYQFYLKLKEKGFERFALIFLIFVLSTWSMDAGVNAKKSFNGIFLPNDKLEASDVNYMHMLQEAKIDVDDYQAIFFLPFANTSGDKLMFENGMDAFAEAMRCSYHTELPLIQSFSPRLPFSNALSSIQLLADSTIRKTRLDDLNQQPVLLVMTNEKMTEQEQWLKNNSELLYTYGNVSLAKIDLKIFERSHQNWLNYADSIQTTLIGTSNLKANVPLEKIYTLDFEQHEAENSFHDKGAQFERRKTLHVFNENFSKKGINGAYDLSFWMFFDTRMYNMPRPILLISNSDGKIVRTIRLNNRHIHNVYGNWVRVQQDLNIEDGLSYRLEIDGKYITIDDLLLKPKGSNVIQVYADGTKQFNNFPL